MFPAPNQDVVPEPQQFNKLTFLPILLKTLSLAMMEWPLFRGSITPELPENAKPTLTIRSGADIALALSTPTGLYTPTLTGINGNSVFDIQAKLKNLQHLGTYLLVVQVCQVINSHRLSLQVVKYPVVSHQKRCLNVAVPSPSVTSAA